MQKVATVETQTFTPVHKLISRADELRRTLRAELQHW